MSKTALDAASWAIETTAHAATNQALAIVAMLDRTGSLFLWAKTWDEVDENGIALWWYWENFGTTNFPGGAGFTTEELQHDYENGVDPNQIVFTVAVTNQFVNTSLPPVQIAVGQGVPFYFAVLVDSTNFSGATWAPYNSSNITVNLGSTEASHDVWIGLRGRLTTSQQAWQWLRFKLDTTPPQLVITNPTSTTVSQPMIQLQGYCPEALASFTYDLTNAAGLVTNELVLVTSQFYDTNTFEFTTNTFQAFDIPLTNGPNTITLYATDLAGNVTTTNLTFILDYSGDTNPPAINLFWPQDGTQISASSFTWRGWVDDFTATVTVSTVDTNGNTNLFNALVERNGNFWIENLPLADGTNSFTLAATDAAGNSSSTNINVVKSPVNLTIYPPLAGDTTVNGTMDTSDYAIRVNGIEAEQDGSGTWTAYNVPMVSMGNTTVYQARAIPSTETNWFASSEGSPDNADSANAVDVPENNPDKPAGVYISSYSLTEHWEENSDVSHSTWDHTLTWQDGKAVTETTHGVGHNPEFDYDVVYVDSWSATSWPQPLPGTVTEVVYNNIEGISDTNVFGGYPPALDSEHCDVTFQTNFGNICDTGDVLMTWTRKAQTAYALNTGRKAAPGAKNLWVISAAATEKAVHTSTSSYPPFGVDVTNVPYEQIQIGTLGHLDASGNLYVVLPDGDPPLTPEADGAAYDGISTPTATKYPIIHQTSHSALTDTNLSRTTIGVGEEVNFSNAPDATIWSTSAGGLSSTNGSNTKFTAPSNAVEKVTVTASFPSGKPLELDFQVLEPIGYDQAHTYISATNHYLPGVAVAGMSIHVVFAPTMVSFYRVQIEEVGLDASDVWGFFADTNLFTVNPEHLLHHRSDVFRDLNYDNSWVSDDQCQTSSVFPPPWVPGGYTWEIPGKWRVGADGDQIVILEPWSQIISLDSDGTMTIDKFGLWVERGTNDVIHVGP